MPVDATARKANVKDSLKKFFVDNLNKIEHYNLVFDTTLETPNIRDKTIDRWVVINFGMMDRAIGYLLLEIYCCTRNDNEGFKLAQLSDKVMDYLTDSTYNDGLRRIPLYQSRAVGAWTLLEGGLILLVRNEGEELKTPAETKYSLISVEVRWGTKI